MNTKIEFVVLLLVLAGICLCQEPQLKSRASCEQWFYHFPEAGQQGQVLEIAEQTLRDPRNLKAGKEEWLKTVETTDFKAKFYGQQVTGLTLFYDPCVNTSRLQFGIAKPEQLKRASQNECIPEQSWETVYKGKGGKKTDLKPLVRAHKLTEAQVSQIAGNQDFLNMSESRGTEFSVRHNRCDQSITVVPTLQTSYVSSDGTASGLAGAKAMSGKKVAVYTGASAGAVAAMVFGGPYGMIASPVIAASPYIVGALGKLFKGKPKQPKEKPELSLVANQPPKPNRESAQTEVIQETVPAPRTDLAASQPLPAPQGWRKAETQEDPQSGRITLPLPTRAQPRYAQTQSTRRAQPQVAYARKGYAATYQSLRPVIPPVSKEWAQAARARLAAFQASNYRTSAPPQVTSVRAKAGRTPCKLIYDGSWHKFGECSPGRRMP